jgi:hypothetical protein
MKMIQEKMKARRMEYEKHKMATTEAAATSKRAIEELNAEIEYLQDQDNRIRNDYCMFRDIIKEENVLVRGRLTTFATLQGFLFAAVVFSSIRESDKDLFCAFILLVAAAGVWVSRVAFISLRDASRAIYETNTSWKQHEKTIGDGTYIRWTQAYGTGKKRPGREGHILQC